ncbi:ATP-binding protein [Sinomicrobium soli]|uniref:ATP-binding protein n=1 Tax=Sinomicrobium sp. N-1-3-6 TaxID=2219864 RepID=UPI0013752504|nr:ATP-binding protein [Sinomicrobium sp. N-1-3-6]
MNTKKSTITYKVLLSYIALAILIVAVGWFVYAEFQIFTRHQNSNAFESKKLLITSSLVAHLYETESLARITLQSSSSRNFNAFMDETTILYKEIDSLKPLIDNQNQVGLLDSVKILLDKKVENIRELRALKSRDETDVSLEKAIAQITQMQSFNKELGVEDFVNPDELQDFQKSAIQNLVDLLNENIPVDSSGRENRQRIADSVLTASKELLKDLKIKTSNIKRSLTAKEDELLRDDITISQQLREILSSFEGEIISTTNALNQQRDLALKNTIRVITIAAVLGLLLTIFFSYLILNDFWKSQSYRKQLENAKNTTEQLLKNREQLIYTVGHDLRTPLSTIIGYTDLLHNSEISTKQEQYVSRVKNASRYVRNLVDDLLDYNKLEAGKIKIENTLFSLESIISDTAEGTSALYPNKDIELIVDLEPRLKKLLMGDPFRIKQILTNLIGNAYKFTENGHIRIRAEVLEKFGTTYRVRIDVEDTGIGIRKDKQEVIFNEFTQAESAIEKKYGGTGLGLTISRKLASLLGGSLELKSREGEGSTFTLKVPLQIPSGDNNIQAEESPAIPRLPKKIRAVLIDDDESVLSLTAEILKQQSCKVNGFTKASEALEYLGNNDYDLILTDIQMPDLNGFQFLDALHRAGRSDQDKPVIAITGRADLNREEYRNAGFSEVLQKPFAPGTLVACISKVLQQDVGTQRPDPKEKPIPQTIPDTDGNSRYNLTTLKQLLQYDDEALGEILQTFAESTEKNMETMSVQFGNKDIEGIQRTAHKMFPMFKQIEALETASLLERLEYHINDIPERELDALFGRLHEQVTGILEQIGEKYL